MVIATRSRASGDDGRQKPGHPVKSRYIIAEQIEVGVPADVAFDAWNQYEKWQNIFKNESARPGRKKGASSAEVKVASKIGPSRREWQAEITNLEPGRRIDWKAKGQIQAKGVTTFHSLHDRLTKVMVEVEYRPSGPVESVGNLLRMPRRRVRKDLRLFKNYVEIRDGRD